MPIICTSVSPAGGGSVGVLFADAAAPCELACVFVVAVAGAVCAGVLEGDALSMTVVDDAAVGVDEATASIVRVEVALASVDVASTCARAGLTMVKPMARATMIALAPVNVMMLVFMLGFN